MRTISLHSTSFSLVEFHGTKNLAQSRINRSVSLIPMARSQFQPKIRRDIGTSNRNPSFSWMATVGEKVHNSTVPTSVPVRVALELLQAGHRYLDVRTTEEYNDGHAAGAINIPYMLRIGSGMIKNPNFLEEVLEQFGKDDEIIVGFTGVTDIAGGYAAWTESGLPIES